LDEFNVEEKIYPQQDCGKMLLGMGYRQQTLDYNDLMHKTPH
jgi:hypothetical protein